MEAIAGILNKLSVDDVEKLKILFSINASDTKNVITLRVFVEEYLDLVRKTRTENYYKSVKLVLKHLSDYFGNQRPIGSISFKDVELFITELQKKAPNGYRVYYRTLKAAFNKALDWKYISENHFLKIKLPKKKQLNPDFISEAELQLILNKIENDVVYDAVVFGFYTGMRLNEIMNLKWKNVDLDKGLIVIGDAEYTTKGKNQRYVPICDEVMRVVKRCKMLDVRSEKEKSSSSSKVCKVEKIDSGISKNENRNDMVEDSGISKNENRNDMVEDSGISKKENRNDMVEDSGISKKENRNDMVEDFGISKSENILTDTSWNENKRDEYVFCKSTGFPYTGDYVSKKFKKACTEAGIRDSIHFHSLRHSFASNLVQRGVPLYVIKELLGHSSISVTEIYSHLTLDSLRDAVALLDARPIDIRPLDIRQKMEGRVESLSSSKVCKVGKIDSGISKSENRNDVTEDAGISKDENLHAEVRQNENQNSNGLRLVIGGLEK